MVGILAIIPLIDQINKGATNKIAYMLSQPPLDNIATVGVIMELEPFTHELLSEDYEGYEDFLEVYKQLKERPITTMEENKYHLQDRLLYKLDKLCIP